jgi:hypothetical protein
MARIKVCGICLQPVAACICDDDVTGPEDSSGEDNTG